jgi:16S rRNA (guanine527-N7)-methyltransferase
VAAELSVAIAEVLEASDQAEATAAAGPLADYLALLTRWNRAYNLSAVRDPNTMVSRHIADSLSIRPWLPAGRLLDIGTGPGLPGLVVAIVEPYRPVVLLDSSAKKVRFLRQAAIEMGLTNTTAVQARADTWDGDGAFEVVVSRAFSSLTTFWRLAQPRLTGNGSALAMKGQYPEAELAALPKEGLSCKVNRLSVPGIDGDRHLVSLGRASS